jgi:Protein of unknown function (DUF1573)
MSRLSMMVFAGLLAIGGMGGTAQAQNWPDTLFSERSHDFGPVPRGGVVRHPFVLTNRLTVPITIFNLRVSCGCTSGTASASIVPPGKTAIVEAQMDTRNFVGRKSTTLFVSVMAGNQESEIGLGVSSLILSDVVLNPGVVDFGLVSRGQTPVQTIAIDRIGKPDWKIVKLTSACKAINASLQETQRQNGSVSYQLSVSLKPDATAGVVRDEIRLVTNDPETPSIPVPIGAQIRGELSATPTALALGNVTSAAGVQGKYVVRASKPFAISKVEGTGDGFSLQAGDSNRKPLHILTLTYNPAEGNTRGDLSKTFRITTDLPGEPPIDVTATLHVEP